MRKPPATKPRGLLVLGEVLVDLTAERPGIALEDADALIPRLGGAPANVCVQVARLGGDVALLSAVGSDPFGARVLRVLDDEGVDTSMVRTFPGRRTGCTLVQVDADGERSFFGFRENSADLFLDEHHVVDREVVRFAIVHTGTVSLRTGCARRATRKLVRCARAGGALVSLDVNLRPGMFPDRQALHRYARTSVRQADIVKATRDEARALFGAGRSNDDALIDALLSQGPRLVLLTLDKDGAVVATRAHRVRVSAPRVKVRDATGAGDAFVGAVLATLLSSTPLLRRDLDRLDESALARLGERGCRAGSATVTALGATSAMPRAL